MTETAVSPNEVYSARPTLRVDGEAHRRMTELVIGMEVKESEGGLVAAELRMNNVASDTRGGADFALEDEQTVHLGSRIAIYAGDEGSPQEIFSGVVTGLEAEFPRSAPPELVILAEDSLQQARMTRRTAVHEDVTIADLAEQLAGRLSLQPVVSEFTDNIGAWVQLNESDLAFLRRILARYDGDLQVVGEELHVSPRSEVERGAVELRLRSQLHEARFVADLSRQMTEVTVTGWDPVAGERLSATSYGRNLGPGTGRNGAQILRDALGDRSEHIGHMAVTTQEETQALAHACFDRAARRFVCVEATAVGNPAIRVGTHVHLTGVSPRFENTYYVVSARHCYGRERGYETEFEAESAALQEA